MAIDVGEIVATLRADTSGFSGGIDKANQKLNGFAKGVTESSASLNTAGLGLVSVGGKMTAAAVAMGALGVAAAKEMGTFAEEVGILSQKFGVSESTIQKWNFALNRVGMSAKDLSGGFKKLSTLVTEAFGGDDKAVAKIEKLGVSLDELKGRNPEQIFLTLAQAIAVIENPLERNAALTATFGKAGMSLVPILDDVIDGFSKSGKEAEALGLVFSGNALGSAQALDDSFDDLTATMAGFSRTLATTFQGPLKDVIVALTQMLGAFNVWWQGIDAGVKKVVLIFAGAFALSGPIIAMIGAFMVAAAAGLGPLMVGGAIVTGLIAAVTAIIVNWESIKAKGVAIWAGIRDSVTNFAKSIYDGIKLWMVDKFEAIVMSIKGVASKVLDVFKWLRHEVVGGSEVPDMVEEIGDHMRMLDKNMTAPARVAAQGTWNVFRELAGKMGGISSQIATTTMSAWSSVSNTISGALANQILQGNDWKQTMTSIGTSVLTAFINLGIQMIAQKALQLASWTAINAGILTGEITTASAVTSIWAATGGAVLGTFGAMATGIMGFFSATIMPMLIKLGTMMVTFLTGIASSLTISIFGAPFAVPVWAAVGVMAAAVGALAAYGFGAFAEGGVVTKPMMGLVGEAGPEAIIPLSKLDSMGGGKQTTIVIELDGRTIAKSVFDQMPSVMRVRGISA